MVKSVRTFNASDEVNILIEAEAPKGKGFSAWVNEQIMRAKLNENVAPPMTTGKIIGVKI